MQASNNDDSKKEEEKPVVPEKPQMPRKLVFPNRQYFYEVIEIDIGEGYKMMREKF